MAEHLDNKLPQKWHTMYTRKLVIYLFHHISKRLTAIESALSLTPPNIKTQKCNMNKIKRGEPSPV